MRIFQAFAMRVDLPPSAERQEEDLEDLTTARQQESGTVSPSALHLVPEKKYWTRVKAQVAGRLVQGTLPEDHRARFLLRMPRQWNGGLVVAAAAGVADPHCYDIYLSDFALQQGYAFAVTDKAVKTATIGMDTVVLAHTPEGSISQWSKRLDALANLASTEAANYYGSKPRQIIAFGISNGGYLARRAAESKGGIYNAALDISGVLWRRDSHNLLRELPLALRASATHPWNTSLLEESGMPDLKGEWLSLAKQYKDIYWQSVMHLFLGDFDPLYSGPVEDYDLDTRPPAVGEAIEVIENSGDLQVPCISVAGRRDYLISCKNHAVAYEELVKRKGKSALFELSIVENGAHVDSNSQQFSFISPLMPYAHEAFQQLVKLLDKSPVSA